VLGEAGDGVIQFLSTIYNYNTMPNHSIQNGGAFITVINPTTGKREIITDPIGNSRVLFDNLTSVQSISVSSYGSFVFECEIPQPVPETLIHIRSQSRSKTRRPLTQHEALARPRNIEHGNPLTHVCMKVVFVGDKPGRITDLYTKEIVTLDTAVQEVQTQHRMYRKLISGGTGANTEIIPDAFGSCLLTHEDFKALIHKSKPSTPSSPIETQYVLAFIERIARTHKLQLYVSFIEYLTGYSPFNESDPVHKPAISTIGAYVLAIFLKTGCISLDMHSGNIMIHNLYGSVQFIDFGRLICLFQITGKAEVKEWFKAYSVYCQYRDLEYLHMCFSPARGTGMSATQVTVDEVQEHFNRYCDTLETRLQRWLTPRPRPTTSDDIKEVFDLLTFIGFIDCLCGFSKKRPGQTIFLMQFGLCMNLLLGREIKKPFLIDDIIRIRSNFDKRIREHKNREQFKKRLIEIVGILSQSLQPDESLGTPRSADSFEYHENSDEDEQEIIVVDEASSPKKSKRSRSRGRSRSPGRKKHKAGGRKPITKKRRRVKRKIRTSLRNR
jgi:hypothetical protein